jgi:hypothetical protein
MEPWTGVILGVGVYAMALTANEQRHLEAWLKPAAHCQVIEGTREGAQAWAPSIQEALRVLSRDQLMDTRQTIVCAPTNGP